MGYYEGISVVRDHSLGTDIMPRYVIVDRETKEVLDDANGYGYKTPENAYAAWRYKRQN